MFGWGHDVGWFHSDRNSFLHVIKTHITTFSEGEKATISLENNKKISTKPDLKTGVRMYINLNEMWASITFYSSLILFYYIYIYLFIIYYRETQEAHWCANSKEKIT